MDLNAIHRQILLLPEEERIAFLDLLYELEKAKQREASSHDFLSFVKQMWPNFVEGAHHRLVAKAFGELVNGDVKRLMIFMPPRHTKSEFASHYLPAWYLGLNPTGKVMQTSNKAELAIEFGRKVRNLVNSDIYHEVFPTVSLAQDSKAAGRWHTNHGGEYFAAGVGGAVTGRGADLLIIDDPHSEQEAASNNPDIYDTAYQWYTSGPRQRLQPGGRIVMVVTRWSKIDLPGQVLRKSIESGDDWKIIELPAILDEHTDKERPVWPEFWDLEELKKTRDTLPVAKWSAQWQQKPTSEEGAIVKREWWKRWEHKRPPDCEMIIQSWDTALTTKDYSDFSACTTWGIFYNEDGVANIMLLDAYKGRLEFPDLKDMAMKLYKERQPEAFIIEAKAAGQPLVSEFRRMGIPVHEYVPARGARGQSNDKLARLNSVSDLFRSGHVWAPADKNWADMVIEEMAEFPYGEHDDLVDATVMALMRFREGGFISLNSDDPWKERVAKRVFNYY